MSHYFPEEAAMAAASDAADAVVELIRYAREGEHSKRVIFADEVVTKLAAALLLTLELECEAFEQDEVRGPLLTAMQHATREYLQGEGHEV